MSASVPEPSQPIKLRMTAIKPTVRSHDGHSEDGEGRDGFDSEEECEINMAIEGCVGYAIKWGDQKKECGNTQGKGVGDGSRSDRPLIAKFWVKKKRSADSHKTRDVEPDDSDSEPTDQSNVLVEMPAHMKNWESIVKRIDTIVPDGATGSPMVYFTLKKGMGHGKEPTAICREKMPNKLFKFYESNLVFQACEHEGMEQEQDN